MYGDTQEYGERVGNVSFHLLNNISAILGWPTHLHFIAIAPVTAFNKVRFFRGAHIVFILRISLFVSNICTSHHLIENHISIWHFDLTIFWRSYLPFWHRIFHHNVCKCNSCNSACMFITIWRITYRYGSLIEQCLKELLPFFLLKYYIKKN